ncbi:polymeric immunoglobulin receptor isoform X2 [Etheostoma spectabile]|uniref:polymeric immunoglobulin receptor isoform X2 n=1 Tax=Etheostoma spectabile TaxID=54343 RepID=UPI0013AEC2D7|nr:polymeric immunoglobulin receptor-like isoform X2 [Etheostoma spectabile]
MLSLYVPHLILAGLIGIHSKIVTVSKASVKAGGSISIPCLYELGDKNHVKYLCKGNTWHTCSYAVTTNQPYNSGKFSIYDDINQRTFIVKMNDLTDDGGSYWCAVEKGFWDVKQHFELSVTTGMPSLYVDHQEIIAFEGRSVTVRCHCKDPKITQWCRLGGTCVSDQTGSIDGTTVTINDSVPNGFTVTLMELKTESSGWYWCNNGDFQMPVHVTVHESTTTTTTTLPNTANLTGRLPTTQHSSLLTNAEPHTAQPTNSTINRAGGENLQDEHKSSTIVTILSTTLVLLLLVVPAAFFGWRMMIKDKTKLEGSDITVNNLPKESVTYSTIVIKDSVRQLTEPVDGSVIYSTVKHNKC